MKKTLSWETWKPGLFQERGSGRQFILEYPEKRGGRERSSPWITEYKNYKYETVWQVAICQAVLYLRFKK